MGETRGKTNGSCVGDFIKKIIRAQLCLRAT